MSSRPNGSREPGWRPAAASSAIAPLLCGADRAVTVLASFPQAAYLRVGDDLVALVTSDGIRQPNALVLDLPSTLRPLDRLTIAPEGRIGHHRLSIGDLELRIVRWWDPRPRLRRCTPAGLRATSDVTRQRLASFAGPSPGSRDTALDATLAESLAGVVAALAVGDGLAALAAAENTIGLGPGLTPSGDDQLAGLIAGTLVLAGATAAAGIAAPAAVVAAAQGLGDTVTRAAVGRTTSVSAALLAHAALGQLADPATGLVRAWTSHAGCKVAQAPARSQNPTRNPRPTRDAGVEIGRATDRLLAVGSSSGRDLTLGLLAAVELLTGEHAGSTPAGPWRATSPRTHPRTTERAS